MEPDTIETVTRQMRREHEESEEDQVDDDKPEPYEKAYLVREFMDQFVGMGRDDRDQLCDTQHQSAFLSEIGLAWNGGQGTNKPPILHTIIALICTNPQRCVMNHPMYTMWWTQRKQLILSNSTEMPIMDALTSWRLKFRIDTLMILSVRV